MNRIDGSARPLIAIVVGTRPEAIKLLPVVRALAERATADLRIILTGQHKGLATPFESLPRDAVHELAIDVREQTAGEICERIHHALCGDLARLRPALVLVQGDTSSALAGALAGRDCFVPVGHVEAGLRSFDFDEPWPEEQNRVEIDRLAALLFAPTDQAAANIARERLAGEVHVTGNSGIDALFMARGEPACHQDSERRIILVTCHRRENSGVRLRRIAAALRRLPAELPVGIRFPLHTNRRRSREIEAMLGDVPHLDLLPPQDHRAMVRLIGESWLILTDSGGLQEEGPALGKPVLVMREATERVEASGNSELVGTDPDRIVGAVARLLGDPERYARMATPSLAYGDGKASARIADAIERFLLPG